MSTSGNEAIGLENQRTDVKINIDEVRVEGRIRQDFGNIDELANSIQRLGIIQPIVVTRDLRLVAGERRLRAMRKLGISLLVHAGHFIYSDEQDELRLQAMEAEENIRRKALTWQEEVLAKKKIFDTLQQIHGPARPGAPSRSDSLGITSPGFGVNKLAALLGESNAQTSKDLELANLITAVPFLAKAETKEAARRQASLATTVAASLIQQKLNPPKVDAQWTLYEGDFQQNAANLPDASCDLVLVDPPYGEDTTGMGPQSKTLLATAFEDSRAYTEQLLVDLVSQTWRVLRADSFAAIFFGFTVYRVLVDSLLREGFDVDLAPLIWVKNTVINTTPYTRYGRSYEPILLARKGYPKLYRPSQRDVFEFQNVITRGTNETKLYHAQKPVELMEKLVLDLSPPGGTVVDFCAGSGSTGVAALRQKRRVVLFERDAAAIAIIKARLGAL